MSDLSNSRCDEQLAETELATGLSDLSNSRCDEQPSETELTVQAWDKSRSPAKNMNVCGLFILWYNRKATYISP